MIDLVKSGERLDDLQYNNLQLIQNPDAFCFGCDAVEIANFVKKATSNCSVACDLGSGNGIISILLAGKKGYRVSAVEVQQGVADLCKRNTILNNLHDKVTVYNIDMQSFCKSENKGAYDIVVSNPPYENVGSGFQSEKSSVKIARSEELVTLKEVIASASHLTKFGGKFYIVHKTERMAEVLTLCTNHKLEPKILQILRPNEEKKPHLFLLSCTNGGKKGLIIENERAVNAFNV